MIKKIELRESADVFGYGEYTQFLPQNVKDRLNYIREPAVQLAKLINDHEYILTYTDAKLHDVFYEFDDVDDVFLDVEWQYFEEYVKEKDCEVQPVRTSGSKFYIRNSFMDQIDEYTDDRRGYIKPLTPDDVLWAMVEWQLNNAYLLSDISIILDDDALNTYIHDKLMDEYEVDFNDVEGAVKAFIDENDDYDFEFIYDLDGRDFKSAIEDVQAVIDCYDYIEDFKKNQVQIYQDFLGANEE